MYDIEPTHSVGLFAGLLGLLVATIGLRVSPAHRRLPITTQIAAVLMAVTGVIHLALIPQHLTTDPITGILFLFNGVAFIALAAMVRRRWWRLESAALIVLTVFGYLLYMVFGLEEPDQVGLATKVIEITALGMILVPAPGDRRRRDRSWYWALLAAGLPALVLLNGTAVWAVALTHPDPRHVHAGALLQSTNAVPTREQQAAATRLYEETLAAIGPYQDWHRAWAAGYRPGGSQAMPSTHWMNQGYVNKGVVLDPKRPQGLVYANTHHGPVLLGAMFQMDRVGEFGPDPGGPLTAWHQHENICFTPFGFEFSLMTPYATCPLGSVDISASPMLHVWVVDNPQGPFAVDIDSAVVARIDLT
jgi:hypothetical protein